MTWLASILGSSAGGFVDALASAADRFITTDEERKAFAKEMQELARQRDEMVEQTIRKELEAKERVLVAELQQADNYTKRARPTVVYCGLLFIFFNYCLFPAFGSPALALPAEFWMAWGGICATWVIGRSAEKVGINNNIINKITGHEHINASKSIYD